ncbi:butyrophilin subfamily 1 member A1-like isoform X2 [Thamnophis elegans]|uniref:butyrophilin subfamily 1 member A1-like isoform X2 n=1 Tax=Thamnophis elegans TaxID=35005 RepID=UPI001377FFA7|nr:butyrophilin subfamily 1 member A1-like isoform X2 [Thamnophis elegans]
MNPQPHHLTKPGVHPTLISTQPKDAPSYLWPRNVFLILLIASIALKCTVIVMVFSANLTLNPSTAHPQLYISSDLKSVRWRGMNQQVHGSLLRYDVMASVLSHEGFNSGKLCWEVEVVDEGEWWGVGIVRESANRNGLILLDPRGGYWGVQRINGQHQSITQPRTNLTLCHSPRRIRVSLDYLEGLVAFFDGDTNAEIFTFPKANFAGEKIHAWFLIYKWNGQLLLHP